MSRGYIFRDSKTPESRGEKTRRLKNRNPGMKIPKFKTFRIPSLKVRHLKDSKPRNFQILIFFPTPSHFRDFGVKNKNFQSQIIWVNFFLKIMVLLLLYSVTNQNNFRRCIWNLFFARLETNFIYKFCVNCLQVEQRSN